MTRKEHWESVYGSKGESEVSWTQSEPRTSLKLITEVCRGGRVIDVGAGASTLAERLVGLGYVVAALDISEAALSRAKTRMGPRAGEVEWIVADVTAEPDLGVARVWHDRAVFHFLTDPLERAGYVGLMGRTVLSGGYAIVATFALDGPEKCSGLPVCRYDGSSLAAELGEGFQLVGSVPEMHVTPWGKGQSFQYSLFERR